MSVGPGHFQVDPSVTHFLAATDFKAQIRAVVIAVQGSPSKWRLSCSGQRVANECGEIAALNGFPANESPNVT
uniref:Cupin n=1 Tax=Ascaris lumbricoides TaxID=6252 RepID=A0A0M3HVC4_ASCLU